MKKIFAAVSAVVLSANLASANNDHVAPITAKVPMLQQQIVNDLVLAAIRDSNRARTGIQQDAIDELEAQWQSELDSGEYDLIQSVVETSLGDHLRSVIDGSDGLVLEINVMDASGLSVGQSGPNSDIWQGEEAKYQKTYLIGPDAVFVDEVEEDGSTQAFLSQANFTIADPASGEAIGAVSVGVDVDVAME